MFITFCGNQFSIFFPIYENCHICGSLFYLILIQTSFTGTFSIILHVTALDAVTPFLAAIEILTINNKTWIFSQNMCPIYNGAEILINCLQLWLIICINFHVISLWNLHQNESNQKTKNPLTCCQDESNECLVSRRESTRVINIDYRRRKEDISVAIPCILIWFFCLSLSIPNFTLSSTLRTKQDHVICAVVDNYYGHLIQILILVFRVILPFPLLLFSLICIILKLTKSSLTEIKNILTKDFSEIRVLLIFCICLTVLYMCTSFQRSLFHFLHISSEDFYNSTETFKVPPLYNTQLNISNNMSLTMLHYSCNSLRAVLLFYLLPKFKDLLRKKVFVCF